MHFKPFPEALIAELKSEQAGERSRDDFTAGRVVVGRNHVPRRSKCAEAGGNGVADRARSLAKAFTNYISAVAVN